MKYPSYIQRMEVEFKELHEKYVKLKNYLEEKEKENAPTGIENPMSSSNQVSPSYHSNLEFELLRDQRYAMESYMRSLGARLQIAKATVESNHE